MNPRPSNQSRNRNAWSLTTLGQTPGCRIPLVRTVIVGIEAYRDGRFCPRSEMTFTLDSSRLLALDGFDVFARGGIQDLLIE